MRRDDIVYSNLDNGDWSYVVDNGTYTLSVSYIERADWLLVFMTLKSTQVSDYLRLKNMKPTCKEVFEFVINLSHADIHTQWKAFKDHSNASMRNNVC